MIATDCNKLVTRISRNLSNWPQFSVDEIAAVTHILASGKVNYWTGNEGKVFEKEFAEYIGVNHAIAVMNGTVALEAALHALDIGPGDEVIVPCRTFIASASAVIAVGATPVMADVDNISQNITVNTAQAVLTARTKAIIVVHLAGWPCDMEALNSFAKKHQLKIIEDCAQAIGATLNGKKMGAWGDIATFSFCQDKIMTTGGEGGMITTNDTALWRKIWSYKDHGKNYDTVFNQQHPPGFRWLHESFGTNLRMTEMQAAIGRIQLRKLKDWIAQRRNHANLLTKRFLRLPALRVTQPDATIKHSYYKYYVFVKPDKLKLNWSRDRIIEAITAENIPCFSGSCSEIYLEKAFQKKMLHPVNRLTSSKRIGRNQFDVFSTSNTDAR